MSDSSSFKQQRVESTLTSSFRLASRRLPQDLERHCLAFVGLVDVGTLLLTSRGVQAAVQGFLAVLSELVVPHLPSTPGHVETAFLTAVRAHCKTLCSITFHPHSVGRV